jgi:hypothetical protein
MRGMQENLSVLEQIFEARGECWAGVRQVALCSRNLLAVSPYGVRQQIGYVHVFAQYSNG